MTLQPLDDGSANSLLFLAREGVCLYLCSALLWMYGPRTGLIILRTKTLEQKKKGILALERPHIVVRSNSSSFCLNVLLVFVNHTTYRA